MTSSAQSDMVGDDEFLIREVCDPDQFDDNGNIRKSAIQLRDLYSRGFSVHRRDLTTADFIKNVVRAKCQDREGWKECVAVFKTGCVRAITYEGRKPFCVISEPIDDNPAHAGIYFSPSETSNITKADAREMRSLLFPFLKNPMTVEEAFQAHLNCPG